MRRDLEDGIRGRVDDPLPGSLVLLPELLDDLGPRRRLVAEDAPARPVHERVDHVVRKALRVGGKRRRRDDAHQLPVPGRRVLSLRTLEQPAGDCRRARLRRAALEWLDVAQAERLEVGQVEPTDRPGDVAERVRALVAVRGGIRQRPGTDGVQHNHAGTRHRAILGWSWMPSLGCSVSSSSPRA